MKEFIRRSLTGALFVTVMLAAIWYHEFTLLALLMFIAVMALTEFFNMNKLQGSKTFRIFTLLGGLAILVLNFLVADGNLHPKFLAADAGILLILQAFPLFSEKPEKFISNFVYTTTGLVYILLPLSIIPFICFSGGNYDYRLIFGFFILLWTYDSFAYLTGVLTGRHHILPSVSPKKSWEGLAGGTLFSVAMAYPVSLVLNTLTFPQWAGIAIIVVLFGTTGDFIESALKRNAGIKDSGRFLPGHGGILDRFDSVLFSIPFVYLYLALIIA